MKAIKSNERISSYQSVSNKEEQIDLLNPNWKLPFVYRSLPNYYKLFKRKKKTIQELSGFVSARSVESCSFFKYPNLIISSKLDAWLRSFHLVPVWETHKDCQEPYIWHGYRPNPSSFLYCLKSAFYPSNESLNVWTHFIPFFFMVWRTFQVYSTLADPFEKLTHPFWIQSLGCCMLLLTSSLAHWFACYSATGQEVCYCLDYGMIPFFGLTVAISLEHYSCPFQCYGFYTGLIPHAYLVVILVIAVFGTYVTCLSRYPTCPLKYLCRFGPYALCFVIGSFPCAVRFFTKEKSILESGKTFQRHCTLGQNFQHLFLMQFLSFAVAVLFVGFRFPEKHCAGLFDIVGHSHQWFHSCIAVGIYLQHLIGEGAMKEAIQLRDQKIIKEEALNISVWTTLIPLLLFLFIVPVFIYRIAKDVGQIVKINREKKI